MGALEADIAHANENLQIFTVMAELATLTPL